MGTSLNCTHFLHNEDKHYPVGFTQVLPVPEFPVPIFCWQPNPGPKIG